MNIDVAVVGIVTLQYMTTTRLMIMILRKKSIEISRLLRNIRKESKITSVVF